MIDREAIIDSFDRDAQTCGDEFVMIPTETYDGVLVLLNEQEAVKPEREHSGSGVTWWNVCGACKTAINPNDKFCHECGKPILWE